MQTSSRPFYIFYHDIFKINTNLVKKMFGLFFEKMWKCGRSQKSTLLHRLTKLTRHVRGPYLNLTIKAYLPVENIPNQKIRAWNCSKRSKPNRALFEQDFLVAAVRVCQRKINPAKLEFQLNSSLNRTEKYSLVLDQKVQCIYYIIINQSLYSIFIFIYHANSHGRRNHLIT